MDKSTFKKLMEQETMQSVTGATKQECDCWDAIGADVELAPARKKLSMHEIRLIVRHAQKEKEAEIAELRKENEELRKQNEWQDISTAPRDGTPILCYLPYGGGFIMQTYWENYKHYGIWYCESGEVCPTHWLPLSKPPTTSEVK